MATLYFVRHAESEANKKRILGSQLPFPLTEEGRADAAQIAAELAGGITIHRIISSPLVRAVQTAEAFRRVFGGEIETDPRVAEQHLGIFSGMSYDEVKIHPHYERDSQKRWDWTPEGGGESYRTISERVVSFLNSLEEQAPERNILIVTHAVTLRLFEAVLRNTLPEYPSHFPNNGEIWKVDFKKTGSVHEIESILLGNSEAFVHNP